MSFLLSPSPAIPSSTVYQLPNDGDALIVASVNQCLSTLADNAACLLAKTLTVYTPENYGYVSGDATAFIQAALDGAQAGQGRGVVVLNRYYTISSSLRIGSGVSLVVPGYGGLRTVTASFGPWIIRGEDLSDTSKVTIIEGLEFQALVSNDGPLISDVDGATANRATMVVRNCSTVGYVGSPQLFTGSLVSVSGAGTRVLVQGCRAWSGDPLAVLISAGRSDQVLEVDGCYLRAHESQDVCLINFNAASGRASGTTFDFSDWDILSSPTGVQMSGDASVVGNTFLAADPGSTTATARVTAVKWTTDGADLCISGNRYVNIPIPFGGTWQNDPFAATVGLGSAASQVDRQAGFWASTPSDTFFADQLFLPAGYAAYWTKATSTSFGAGTDGAIVLPNPTHLGEQITVVLYNDSGAQWTASSTAISYRTVTGSTLVKATDTVPNGSAQRTVWLCANDVFGSPGDVRWVLVSKLTEPNG